MSARPAPVALHRLQVVGEHAEVGGHRAGIGDQRRQHRRVGIVDLPALERPAAPLHLIAGRDDGDLQALVARRLTQSQRSQRRQVLRPQHRALGQHRLAGFDILPGLPDVGAALQASRDGHDRPTVDRAGAHVLLHDDGIVPVRHDGAGEDAHGGLGRRPLGQPMPGRRPARHGQLASGRRIVVGSGKREAVDRRIGMRRHRPGRDRGRGQDAPGRLGQGYPLRAHHRPHPLLQDRQRCIVPQALGIVRKAVVEELVLHRPHLIISARSPIPGRASRPRQGQHIPLRLPSAWARTLANFRQRGLPRLYRPRAGVAACRHDQKG